MARRLHIFFQLIKLSKSLGEKNMDNTNYIALSRQMALWKQMDIVSNNMANMNTSGYKQDDAVFTSFMVQTPDATGIGKQPLYFTQDFGEYHNFAEGALVETGNTFDLALKGDAFFCIETPQGERYTRKGQFSLNGEGMLTTMDGDPVLSENGEPFFFAPGENEISISEAGEVVSENGVIGRLKLVSFADNQKLLKVAGTMFENVAGNAMQLQPAEAVVVQGAVEKSNVDSVVEMTKLIKLQRSYEYVQQMIDEEHERISNTISTYAQLA